MLITYLLLPIDSIACHGGPMNVRPASVHFLANVGFSLSYLPVSLIPPHRVHELLQSRSPDECPDSLAPSRFVLFYLHRDMPKGLRGLRRTASSVRVVIEHLGL